MTASSAPIYFDNNATTRVFPEVRARMDECWSAAFANPGSAHSFGRAARTVLEDSRETIAGILGADVDEVIFTSGGTESINMAVRGLTPGRRGTIALTAGEHPATVQAVQRCREQGWETVTLDVDDQGGLRDEQWDTLPWDTLRLVCVILAHNETGVIQNIADLSDRCRSHGVPLLVDAVQAVGKIPVRFDELGVTALAFGAHKFHGPRGIGGLLLRQGTRMPPLLEGGHQEQGRRAGTEPVPLIAGMAEALRQWHANAAERMAVIADRRDRLEDHLRRRCPPVVIHAAAAERLPNTACIGFPGISGESLMVNLHLQGLACSQGSTCASGSAEAAPALLAMGVAPDVCHSSLRFSLSVDNTEDEVDRAAELIAGTVNRLRSTTGD